MGIEKIEGENQPVQVASELMQRLGVEPQRRMHEQDVDDQGIDGRTAAAV